MCVDNAFKVYTGNQCAFIIDFVQFNVSISNYTSFRHINSVVKVFAIKIMGKT